MTNWFKDHVDSVPIMHWLWVTVQDHVDRWLRGDFKANDLRTLLVIGGAVWVGTKLFAKYVGAKPIEGFLGQVDASSETLARRHGNAPGHDSKVVRAFIVGLGLLAIGGVSYFAWAGLARAFPVLDSMPLGWLALAPILAVYFILLMRGSSESS
jgi:hypothetical protein